MADFTSLKQTIQSYVKQNGNEEITGNILQDVLLAMVSTMGDGAINGLASALQDESAARQNQDGILQENISTLGGRIDTLQTAINGINTKLAEGYLYAGIASPSTNPGSPSCKVFYVATGAGAYTHFGNISLTQGVNILKYNGSGWSSDLVWGVDDEPTKDSNALVKSKGVYPFAYRFSGLEGQLDGNTLYDNLFNKFAAYQNMDVNSSTGELVHTDYPVVTSDLIEVDATKKIKGYGANLYYYAYDSSKNWLGFGTNVLTGVIVANTYPTAKYIRIQTSIKEMDACYLMYDDYKSDTYVPYNPVDGNIAKSRFLYNEVLKQRLTRGYFFRNSYLDIDNTEPFNMTITIVGPTSYILTDKEYFKNTGLPLNTPMQLYGVNNYYFTIMYDKANNRFVGLTDFTGDMSQYVYFGIYDYGYIQGNDLCPILVKGKVKNKEIELALDEYELPTLDEIVQDVQENTTAIGVNAAAISAEAGARQSADNALGARIDNLVAPTGESVAEITDARVGYDGTTYASLEARLNAEAGRVRNVLVVGTGGQYQTIAAAVDAAANGDVVFIKRGVYEEHVVNRDKIVHIIGESKKEVIWKYPNTDYGTCDCYDCGMGSVRNLTMWNYDNGGTPSGQYGRSYCVHLDHFSYYEINPPISNYFYCENVYFLNDSNESVGLGLRKDMIMEFVNCDFETLSGNEASFYVHSGTSTTITNAKCILKNCTIKNNSAAGQQPALRIEGYWETDGGCTAVMERNIAVNIGGGPAFEMQKSHHYGSQTVENWQGVSDWLLDPRSALNNISALNY